MEKTGCCFYFIFYFPGFERIYLLIFGS